MSAPVEAYDDRILEQPEYDCIKDIAEQIDLLAYLVAMAADPATGLDERPRAVDLHLPNGGLNAMLRAWSDGLLQALEVTDQSIPIQPQTRPVAKVKR